MISAKTRRITTITLGIVTAGLMLFAVFSPALAQWNQEEGFVQCTSTFPTGSEATPGGAEAGASCDLCDLFALLNNATVYAAGFIFAISAVFIMVSGYLYVTAGGDEARLTQAKNTIKFAIVGFIIALLSGIMVKTIVVSVFGGTNLGTFSCAELSSPISAPPAQGEEQPPSGPPTEEPPAAEGEYTSGEAFSKLQEAGFEIAPGAGLKGIQKVSVDDAIAFKNRSGCSQKINSGTGGSSHDGGFKYSHANGYKFDIDRPNACMDGYVSQNFNCMGTRSDGALLWRDPATGNVYANEGSHWDVAYCRGNCNNAASYTPGKGCN